MSNRRFNVKEQLEKLHVEVPKALLYEDIYKPSDSKKGLSNDAKLLYAILQDRTLLSIYNAKEKNDTTFIDKDGDIFIYFDNISLGEILNISEKKVRTLKKELITFDLLEDVRQGVGKANRLYLNKPVSTVDNLKLYTNAFQSIVDVKKEIERKRIEQYRLNKAKTVENTLNGHFDRTSTDDLTVPVQSILPSSNNYKSKTEGSKTDFKDFKSVVVVYTNAYEIQNDSSLNTNNKLRELSKLMYMNSHTETLVSEFIENNIILSEKQINMISKLEYEVAKTSLELTVAQNGQTFSYFYKIYKTEEQKSIDAFVDEFGFTPIDTTYPKDNEEVEIVSEENITEESVEETKEIPNTPSKTDDVNYYCYENALKNNWEIGQFTYNKAKKYCIDNNLEYPKMEF